MFWKRRKQTDFSAEIESHIAIEAERLRAEGVNWADAEAAARRNFGNILQMEERFYERRRVLWLEDLLRDIGYATRVVRQSPGFALTVILTLALGIGSTAALFGVTDAALIKPLPFPQAQKLVKLYYRWRGELDSPAPADYLDYQREAKSFEELAAVRENPFNLGGQDRPERVHGAIVTPSFFSVMKVAPELGRTLDSWRDKPGGARTVVLSDSLWKSRYGGSSNVLGETVLVNGEPATVVGIMPPYFTYPGNAELWISARFRVPEHPLRPLADPSASRTSHYFDIVGRLKPDVNMQPAQAEAEVIARRLRAQYKDEEGGQGPLLVGLRDDLVGNARAAIFILLAAVGVLFLIACANVANVVLARGTTRQREIAIRGSLGAGRLRLIRQLTVENLLLSFAGAALGLAVAACALRMLQSLLPAGIVSPGGLRIDLRLVVFAAATAIFSTLLFGLFPAILAANTDLNGALKEGGRTLTGSANANRSRKVLLVTQVALAAILLIGAGLLIHSLDCVLSAPEGFRPDHVLSVELSLPQAQYGVPGDRSRFATEVLERIRSLAGVRSVAITSRLPLNPGGSRRGIEIKGHPLSNGELSPDYITVSPDYFQTLRIPILKGRVLTDRDTAAAPGVMVVNAAMARHFWPNGDAIGQHVKTDRNDWSQVVGVVGDVAQHELDKAPYPAMYIPYAQDPWPAFTVVIRTGMDPKNVSAAAIAAIHHIDKDEPVYNVRTMDEVIASSVRAQRFRTVLLSLFAALALALGAIGIYGVMAYTVAQRDHEIGIRLALGAQPREIRRTIVLEALRLAGYGILAGLFVSLVLTRFVSGMLYGVRASDPLSFSAALVVLLLAALLASYIPATRAMNMDPADVLRAQ
ncbi:MAG TPA: ABC transporter permease [Bryobacteraceae bacterium]|jgi:putative ABC transport system permease protein|nr:ABC transporter permease [Bryobacteraceae bacterium]